MKSLTPSKMGRSVATLLGLFTVGVAAVYAGPPWPDDPCTTNPPANALGPCFDIKRFVFDAACTLICEPALYLLVDGNQWLGAVSLVPPRFVVCWHGIRDDSQNPPTCEKDVLQPPFPAVPNGIIIGTEPCCTFGQ